MSAIPSAGPMKVITGALYHGAGLKVLKVLHERGVNAAGVQTARGSTIGDPAGRSGLPTQFEKDLLTVVVPAAQADAILELVFEAADIDRTHGAFLYVADLGRSTPYVLDATAGRAAS